MGLSTPAFDAICGLPWPGGLRHEAVWMIQEREAETGSQSRVGDRWKREAEGNAWMGASRYEKTQRRTRYQKAKRDCSAWITGWRKGTGDLIHAQRKKDGKTDTRTYHHARITSQQFICHRNISCLEYAYILTLDNSSLFSAFMISRWVASRKTALLLRWWRRNSIDPFFSPVTPPVKLYEYFFILASGFGLVAELPYLRRLLDG